jgi:tetratricopeptide (TPR) repeat protein
MKPLRMSSAYQSLLSRGKAALYAGAYEAALKAFDELAEGAPGYADVHNLRGLCLIYLNRPLEAVCAFDQALEINDTFADAHVNRGVVLQQLGCHEQAKASFQRSAELAEEDQNGSRYPAAFAAHVANIHRDLGDAYAERGFLLEAAGQYRRACELRPMYVDLRNKLAQALIELGLLEAAIRELRLALADNPSFIEARANLGLALMRNGDVEEARSEFDRCLALDPGNALVRGYFANLQSEPNVGADLYAIESDRSMQPKLAG